MFSSPGSPASPLLPEQVLAPAQLSAPAQGVLPAAQDLGPLAWIADDVRRCLEVGFKALASGQASDAVLPLHQAAGALELAGSAGVARVVGAMEAMARHLASQTVLEPVAAENARQVMQRATFAVLEFIDALLHGRTVSAVALFPQYGALLDLAGDSRARQRAHPADLWTAPAGLQLEALELEESEPPPEAVESIELTGGGPGQFHVEQHSEPVAPTFPAGAALRARLDQAVLQLVKSASPDAATELAFLCEGLGRGLVPGPSSGLAQDAGRQAPRWRRLWRLAAAFFELLAASPSEVDLLAKRSASRLLVAYSQWAAGSDADTEPLAHELLYACAAWGPVDAEQMPRLAALRMACGVADAPALDHRSAPYGRYDPALLAVARKRLAAAREGWATLAGGEVHQLRTTVDQLAQVGEVLERLHAPLAPLAQALTAVGDHVATLATPPTAPLAMEVATAILFLEGQCQDFDPHDGSHAERAQRLAERLVRVQRGAAPEPLEHWIESLYRQASDRQTLGSVVDELRACLGELEKDLDAFFRHRADRGPLQAAPSRLSQMRGVLSVLGLEQAARAVLRMRDQVQSLWGEPEGTKATELVEALGQNLSALGFLIDMLHYQPQMARELFVFDEARGELRSVMGRVPVARSRDDAQGGGATAHDAAMAASQATASEALADSDAELLGVFLEEAAEVIGQGREALAALERQPSHLAKLADLRRCFHTLKGSARMVGLEAFGQAAWALEQVLNAWLAQAREADAALRQLAGRALEGLGLWAQAIGAAAGPQADSDLAAWQAATFVDAADALRLHAQVRPLWFPGEPPVVPDEAEPAAVIDVALPASVGDVTVAELPAGAWPLPDAVAEPMELPQTGTATAPGEWPLPVTGPAPGEWPLPVTGAAPGEWPLPDAGTAPGEWTPPDTETSPADQPVPPVWGSAAPEEVREVGPLRIPAGLFNVFLQEADEDSLRLQEGLIDWARAPMLVPPAELETLAHSLAGSSATVGFASLSELARQMEHVLERLGGQRLAPANDATPPPSAEVAAQRADDAALLSEAGEHVRQLLHQFAAGFLREPDASVLERLRALGSRSPAMTSVDFDLGGLLQEQADPMVFALFEEEALDLLPRLDAAARAWTERPEDEAQQAEVLRLLHTVKGGARLAGLRAMGELAHDLESQAEALPPSGDAARPAAVAELGRRIDRLQTEFEALRLRPPGLLPAMPSVAARPAALGGLGPWVAGTAIAAPSAAAGVAGVAGFAGVGAGALPGAGVGAGAGELSGSLSGANIDPKIGSISRPISRPMSGALTSDLRADLSGGVTGDVTGAVSARFPGATPVTTTGAMTGPSPSPAETAPIEAPAGPARLGAGASASGVVRVRAQLLDRLMNQAGEVMITGSRLEAELGGLRGGLQDLASSVERLRQQLREVEIQAETQMQSRQAQSPGAAGFDPLELDRFSRMQELTRSMAESVNDIATVQRQLARAVDASEDDLSAQSRQTRDLQRDLLRTRMLEIGSIAERLRRTVRQAAQDSGKEVRLEIEGETLEVDRGMLDRMTPVFEHLLRNAVAHGIEPASARQQAGKPACGLLRIVLEQAGNDIALRFEDDGAGLDLDRITAKARSQGLLADTPQALSPAAAADLIFRPGFSTAATVSELAGRGVGLDVVRAEVQALGGRIEVESRPGAGCTFRLLLPLTTAVTHVVLMRCGSMRFGVPASLVDTVLRSEPQVLAAAQAGGQWPLEGGGAMPFFWGGALLRVSRASQESQSRAVPVALLQSAAQRLALQVDEVMGHREVVVKHLGPQLARLPGLAGMTVLATGEVILIYNPVALAAVYGDRARRFAAGDASARDTGGALPVPADSAGVASPDGSAHPSPPGQDANHEQIGEPPVAARQPLVLVVDDSLTVRRVTQRLLQREGYRVALAADGLQALERLAQEAPDLVLSDIEMPRMDGFELARHLRGDPRWSGLPLVFITSRTAPKHREHAQTLGVDHYLGKPYSEDELMGLVRRYCGGPTGGGPAGEAGLPAPSTVA